MHDKQLMMITAEAKNMTFTREPIPVYHKRERYWATEAKTRFRASSMCALPLGIPLPLKFPAFNIKHISMFGGNTRTSYFKVETTDRRPILDMVENTNTIVEKHHADRTMDSADKKVNRIPNTMLYLTVYRQTLI